MPYLYVRYYSQPCLQRVKMGFPVGRKNGKVYPKFSFFSFLYHGHGVSWDVPHFAHLYFKKSQIAFKLQPSRFLVIVVEWVAYSSSRWMTRVRILSALYFDVRGPLLPRDARSYLNYPQKIWIHPRIITPIFYELILILVELFPNKNFWLCIRHSALEVSKIV